MGKNCSNCIHAVTYETPSFLDGEFVGYRKKTSCDNKSSLHWCRAVNNLITCDHWEAQNETR